MNQDLDRRGFVRVATGGLAACLAGSPTDEAAAGADLPATEKKLVLLGLNALARAHELSYFSDGHRGASLISAHLLIEGTGLPEEARSRIDRLFEANWASSPLCRPFPERDPAPEQLVRIGAALEAGRGTLREVGHDAIFAMLAIKGFRLLPTAATPERIDGVCKLIQSIKPWRNEEPDPEIAPPPFKDSRSAARFVLREAGSAVGRFRGFGQGYAGHMLTFGQALIELAAMGDVAWAESCRSAFCRYVTVTRQGPPGDSRPIRDHPPSKLRPNRPAYWQQRGEKTLGLGHVFKYPYSYYELLRLAADPDLEREWEARAHELF